MEDSKIRKFCSALDAEIQCQENLGSAGAGKRGVCEKCPLAIFLDVTRQLFSQPDKSIYDCVRIAVRRSIPTESGRSLLGRVIKQRLDKEAHERPNQKPTENEG
jgi:hypothetical protein